MRRVKTIADRCIGWLLAALMGIAVLNVLWQVFTRFVLNHPSSFTEEAARYLLVWISVIGASYAVGGRMHLAIDLLPNRLAGRRGGIIVELTIDTCVFLFALLVLIVGGVAFVKTTAQGGETSPALGLKVGYVYAALPAAGLIMIFYAALNAIERFAARRALLHGNDEQQG
ncbi:MAG: TRAP transporter small permease [Phycisphaerales bacterium]|nr:MAG: TRAP transporter small permease [Phycisphaerales bacterium]